MQYFRFALSMILAGVSALCAPRDPMTEPHAGQRLRLEKELLELRASGWDAAYRTDYGTARARFAELLREAPEHPDSNLSMAAVIWQEYLFHTRRLQSQMYGKGSSFYAGAGSGKEGAEGDSIDAAVKAAFGENISRAVVAAERLVAAHPNHPDALYFLGSAYGVRAAFEASAERKFWAALRDGLRAVKQHQKVIRLDPGNHDALLTVGLYHYVVGSIPQPFRAIAMLAGVRGSKKQGMEELELVTRSGFYNRNDARTMLVALYRYEGQPRKALEELETLSRAYPENVPLRLESATMLAQLKEYAAARAMFEDVLRGSDRRLLDLARYQYGEALALEGAFGGAAEQFGAAAQAPGAYEGLVGAALLRAGQMYDLAGQRGEALRMYQACLPLVGDGQRKMAERLMREPVPPR